MRCFSPLSAVFAGIVLLGSVPAEGQDRPLLRALFGERPTDEDRSNRDSSSEARGGGGFLLFGPATQIGGSGRPKRVEIDLSEQRLRAYEGNRVVFRSRISSGRGGSTPTGGYRAGPYKSREHYSSLYDNAPMPWSVQVSGNIFIHGYTVVPDYPASHGCIRLPITGRNSARRFFQWVDVGTPIRISY